MRVSREVMLALGRRPETDASRPRGRLGVDVKRGCAARGVRANSTLFGDGGSWICNRRLPETPDSEIQEACEHGSAGAKLSNLLMSLAAGDLVENHNDSRAKRRR